MVWRSGTRSLEFGIVFSPITRSPDHPITRWKMAVLDSKRIVRQPEERAASPAEIGGGAFQNGLGDGHTSGNLVRALAFERRGRDPQEKLQLLRGQMRGIGRNAKTETRNSGRNQRMIGLQASIFVFRLLRGVDRNSESEIRSSRRHLRTIEFRVSIFDFRFLLVVSHFGQRQRVHPPPPSLALIGRKLSWSYKIRRQLSVISAQFSRLRLSCFTRRRSALGLYALR